MPWCGELRFKQRPNQRASPALRNLLTMCLLRATPCPGPLRCSKSLGYSWVVSLAGEHYALQHQHWMKKQGTRLRCWHNDTNPRAEVLEREVRWNTQPLITIPKVYPGQCCAHSQHRHHGAGLALAAFRAFPSLRGKEESHSREVDDLRRAHDERAALDGWSYQGMVQVWSRANALHERQRVEGYHVCRQALVPWWPATYLLLHAQHEEPPRTDDYYKCRVVDAEIASHYKFHR